MALAIEPQRKSMTVGSGGFQARPKLCQVALFEAASQLSKASGIVSKAKSHLVAICSSSACTVALATSRPSTGSAAASCVVDEEFIFCSLSLCGFFRLLGFLLFASAFG